MIDSVLKGTGNSRFLKSAVPAGTSWADALAMLQAGTFPIDLNGINNAGFQQVGTPLNKANLLKDATAAQIGLPPSTTPDGMFQALGNTGELHVWRKTVKTSSDTPAGYTLGDTLTHGNSFIVRQTTGTGYVDAVIQEASSISVSDNGVISASWGGTITLRYGNSVTFTPGRFVKISSINTKALSSFAVDDVVWVPSDGGIQMNFSNDYGYYIEFTKCQKVNAHGIIPAGTITTYPVSTNPNAYQEGEYGKAGYALGNVKTGTFQIGQGATIIDTNRAIIKYGASISVTDTGTASIASESEKTVTSDTSQASVDGLKGKFFRFSQLPFSSSAFSVGTVYFFPANTVFTKQSSGNWYASKYQTVTSHGKTEPEYTIEYLGKLGDKARVQVVSYVGTGTNGDGGETKIPVGFPPKLLVIAIKNISRRTVYISVPGSGTGLYLSADGSSSIYGSRAASVSYVDGEVYMVADHENAQMNTAGETYIAVALG